MLTGKIVRVAPQTEGNFKSAMNRLIGRSSEPVIRLAVRQAMKLMGHQFVMGRTIAEALKNTRDRDQIRYLHSFDMLGEAALTQADADRYYQAYRDAIVAIGSRADSNRDGDVAERPGISIKLSALHPRYEFAKRERVLAELTPRLLVLAQMAREQNIGLTVDAEEADRLELSLDVIVPVFLDGLAGRLERLRPGRAGLPEARAGRDRLARIGRTQGGPQARGSARQGRVLGHRGQAQPGAGLAGLSGVHAQAQHRCRVSGLRTQAARGARRVLPDVRDAQRAHDRGRAQLRGR